MDLIIPVCNVAMLKMNEPRRVKSFVLRQGRLSLRQKTALNTESERYLLDPNQSDYDYSAIFPHANRMVLEIGFGMGKSLLNMAQIHPETGFIGIEVHRPGVGAVLADLKEQDMSNVRVFCADAVKVLSFCISDGSLDAIHIFFPDPWPKRRHHKRRLIQADFLGLLTQKLKKGGCMHLATDWQDYAEHMLRVLSANPDLVNTAGTDHFSMQRGERPLTKYEQRGQRLGHQVWDLIFLKQ